MAKEVQPLLGKVLGFDQTKYEQSINVYKRIGKTINEIGEDYERYGFGTFTQEAFDDIMKNRSKGLVDQYQAKVRKSIEDLNIVSPTIRENMIKQAAKDMQSFAEKIDGWNGLFTRWINMKGAPLYNNHPLFLEQMSIVDGKAVVGAGLDQLIKQHCTHSIQTDTQAAVYQLYQEAKPILEKMQDLLNKSKSDLSVFNPMACNDGLMYMGEDGQLQICTPLIDLVN